MLGCPIKVTYEPNDGISKQGVSDEVVLIGMLRALLMRVSAEPQLHCFKALASVLKEQQRFAEFNGGWRIYRS